MMTTQMDSLLFQTIGKVACEKIESIRSKINDDTATSSDRELLPFLEEITALARNRIAVEKNEQQLEAGKEVWVERTESHFPHIRLHGGALDDDIPA